MPSIPILEFDPNTESVIEPRFFGRTPDLPPDCVMSFFWDEIEKLKQSYPHQSARPIQSEMPNIPVYVFQIEKQSLAVVPMAIGAPMAAAILEEVIARGCTHVIVCGGAGVLDEKIACGYIVLPTAALREEGTSYQYLPPKQDAYPSQRAVEAIRKTLTAGNHAFHEGKTWTTDAIYRETKDKIKRRKQQGCITVEMEAAALFAVAQFRGICLGQLLYGGDDVTGDVWDTRNWSRNRQARHRLLSLAIASCQSLAPQSDSQS
ncbi:MAG: nucleoside phosphorylase [Myxococcota bacterium]|nr:nucleoside phosphorylase [Myxococcota bacterium]